MTATSSNADSDCRSPDAFADLRSASHAQHRARKHRERCRPTYTTCAQRPSSRPNPSTPHVEPQRSPPLHTRRRKRRCNRNKRTWARTPGCNADAYLAQAQYAAEMETFGRIDVRGDDAWIRDVAYREWEGGNWSETCLQQGATWEDVRRRETFTEIGETFGAWGRRRIGEMRRVREARMVHDARPTATDGTQTTLPTTPADIEAHALLGRALRPRRRGADSLPRAIHGYDFFGEYAWGWHRNWSGCFELSSWGCRSTSYWRCYCEAYAAHGRWSPEDRVQPYALEEFIVSSCEDGEAAAAARRADVDALVADVRDMRGEASRMQAVVDTARVAMLTARREVYEEGLGVDPETRDVCDRMGEVYGEIHRLQRGLVDLVDEYAAMCDEVGGCAAVGNTLQGGEEGEGRAVGDAGESEAGWDVVSDAASPLLSTSSSSWSMLTLEKES
jgi:hypothetical protein